MQTIPSRQQPLPSVSSLTPQAQQPSQPEAQVLATQRQPQPNANARPVSVSNPLQQEVPDAFAPSPKQGQQPQSGAGKKNPFDLPPSVISPDSIRQNALGERQAEIEHQVMENMEKAMGSGPSLFPHAELNVDH